MTFVSGTNLAKARFNLYPGPPGVSPAPCHAPDNNDDAHKNLEHPASADN